METQEEIKEIVTQHEIDRSLKTVGVSDSEYRVRGYLALWGGRDLEGVGSRRKNQDGSIGQYFDPSTKFDSDYTETNQVIVDWEHGNDPDDIGNNKDIVLGYVDWKTAKIDDEGLVVERVLNRRHKYMKWLERLIEAGMIGSSSEATPDAIVEPNGRIAQWPLRRDTLTVMPMEPRLMSKVILEAMKALEVLPEPPEGESGNEDPSSRDSGVDQKLKGTQEVSQSLENQGDGTMKKDELVKALQALLPDIDGPKVAAIANLLSAIPESAPIPTGTSEAPGSAAKEMDTEALKSALQKLGLFSEDSSRPPYEFNDSKAPKNEESTAKDAAVKAMYHLRYGEEEPMKQAIFEGAIGKNYRQTILEQNRAFSKALRIDHTRLPLEDQQLLQKQIFPLDHILNLVRDGWSIEEVKTIMVEAQGDLGGDAVPPNWQNEIVRRLPGLTAVRGGGATVVTLANGNSIELPKYTGGDSRYVGALRGAWGNESASPTEKNATTGLIPVMADLYTYKVRMSRSLVEDASNLVSLVLSDMITTMAIDEDETFLVGSGVGRPRGILPGGTNADSLTEVTTGNGSALTSLSPKKLKRGVPSQYRKNGVFIAESDTYGDIEQLQSTDGKFIYEDLSETDMLLGRRIFESEALPSVAASAYPMIFGNLAAYYIVERLGYTIERFHDSNTGINIVEFHIRRRVGGRIVRPWELAVLKVSA